MSIGKHRGEETPGFFTPCYRCVCGEQVRDETEGPREVAGVRANDQGGRGV